MTTTLVLAVIEALVILALVIYVELLLTRLDEERSKSRAWQRECEHLQLTVRRPHA
jgi:hypothetical protein